MASARKIIPVPTVLTADSDDDSVASDLTDPLAAWSKHLAKAASEWNPCLSEMPGKPQGPDVDTESETETEYETESEASDSRSSHGSSSEGYESDEKRPRHQPFLRKKKAKAMQKKGGDDDSDFDPIQVIIDFVGWMFEAFDSSETQGWTAALAPNDMTLLDQLNPQTSKRSLVVKDDEPVPMTCQKSNVLLNEGDVESGLHLPTQSGNLYHDHVVVATEALAFNDFDTDASAHPFTIRNNFVGVVHHVGPEAMDLGIRQGMRVASIVKCDYNSRYVSMPVDQLYVVPKALDAAEMAALFSYYLPAFQALHHGRTRPYRYSRNCLEGRKVLVTGGNRLEAMAVLRLARLGGATDLYVIAPPTYHAVLANIEGVKVLGDFPKNEWLSIVRGKMDLVIDLDMPKSLKSRRKALAPKGRLVCILSKKRPLLSSMYEQVRVSSVKRASLFDFTENLKSDLDGIHDDIKFLLKQLTKRTIRPTIDRFIQLGDVTSAFDIIQGCPLSGAVICEPRKELVTKQV